MDYKEYLLNLFNQKHFMKKNNNQTNNLSNFKALKMNHLMYMNDLKLVKHAYLTNNLFNQLQNENESKDF